MSQKQKILKHLKKNRPITPRQALRLFDCFRLAARISELREDGHKIQTVLIERKGKRYAKYILGGV